MINRRMVDNDKMVHKYKGRFNLKDIKEYNTKMVLILFISYIS
jgi:hypothetical protein